MAKKIFKIIGTVLLWLILLLILAVGVIFIIDKVKDNQEWQELDKAGYVNMVSVGDHNLNVCLKGNENAAFTVVTMQGLNNMAYTVEMESITEPLKDTYRFALVDRSGYGLSDDTHQEQTVEQMITDYRTALQNANVKKPYVLMAHSIGGVYASYWQQHYPDEIKAVIYLDPTQIGSLKEIEQEISERHADFQMYLSVICSKLGIDRLFFNSAEYTVGLQTEEQKQYAEMLWGHCPMSWTVCSEENNYAENLRKTADSLTSNDIPKLYIDAGAYTTEDIKEKIAYSGEIAQKAGIAAPEIDILESSVDDRLVTSMHEFFEKNIQTYIDKLGNVTYINIPGDHCIYKHKPDEVTKAVSEFLDKMQ